MTLDQQYGMAILVHRELLREHGELMDKWEENKKARVASEEVLEELQRQRRIANGIDVQPNSGQ